MAAMFEGEDMACTKEVQDTTNDEVITTLHTLDIDHDHSYYNTNSETSSCNSETLLLASSNKVEQEEQPVENKVYVTDENAEEVLQLTFEDITDNVHTNVPKKSNQTFVGCSNTSMFAGATIDEVKIIPLNIIGSGWEFGSISSIHQRHVDASRSRCDSMNSLRYKSEGRKEDRLLHKIFSSQIGDIDILKKGLDGKDVEAAFLGPKLTEESTEKRGSNKRNIFAVSAGVMLLHIAYYGLRNLQSSMNSEGGLGVISMGIACALYVAGSLVSPFIVQRFGPKRCLVWGTISHIFYIFANYHATWCTIMPTSAILGFGSAILWNSVSTYITELGFYEADTKNKQSSHVISFYFGLFFLSIQLATVIGNLISSLILVPKDVIQDSVLTNSSLQSVTTFVGNNSTVLYSLTSKDTVEFTSLTSTNVSCGIGFADNQGAMSEQTEIEDLDKLFLLGTFASCGLLSVFVLGFCLDGLPNFVPRHSTVREVASGAASVISMLFDRDFVLVIPLCLYSFMSVGFVIADILKAYITCPLGIYMVGYTMICFGLCGSVSSYVFGKLLQYTGRVPIIVTATLINTVTMAAMFTWRPVDGDIYYLFVLIGSWGFADGIWQSQINSLVSTTFADRYETAFGSFRVLQGVAGIIVFSISCVFGMMTKLCITLAMCVVAFVCYLIMEVRQRKKTTTHELYVINENC